MDLRLVSPKIESTKTRPNSPKLWGEARAQMGWHHIIPYALLRQVWNRLVDQHTYTQIPEARDTILRYLRLCGYNEPDLEDLVDRMRTADISQKRSEHPPLKPLERADADKLATAAVWPSWNAVEGWKKEMRSDDPEDQDLDRYAFELTPQEAARARAIETLYRQLKTFVRAGETPGPENLRDLGKAAVAARTVLQCQRPIPYRPGMWVKEGPGQWRKRRHGDR